MSKEFNAMAWGFFGAFCFFAIAIYTKEMLILILGVPLFLMLILVIIGSLPNGKK